MLVFDMSVEGRIAEVSFSTNTNIVTLHRIISGSTFPSWNKLLLALEDSLLLRLAHKYY